uniref:LITAF domain-containing protein n=1 Tax=Gasterosteus aculeatus aculeatus TaxID=481459 RepID=A0AAQ4NPR2_GASAC
MEPPSYEEASLHPSAFNVLPPPYYHGPQHSPPTPPPTYGEAGKNNHPIIIIYYALKRQSCFDIAPAAVVVTQPAPVPVSVRHLGDIPALVRCPHCNRVVTTVVKHVPGMSAWSLCVFLALMGLICGFCLIPFMVQSLQDVHHYCPECKNRLHVHQR